MRGTLYMRSCRRHGSEQKKTMTYTNLCRRRRHHCDTTIPFHLDSSKQIKFILSLLRSTYCLLYTEKPLALTDVITGLPPICICLIHCSKSSRVIICSSFYIIIIIISLFISCTSSTSRTTSFSSCRPTKDRTMTLQVMPTQHHSYYPHTVLKAFQCNTRVYVARQCTSAFLPSYHTN